jgi:hypothetical protein
VTSRRRDVIDGRGSAAGFLVDVAGRHVLADRRLISFAYASGSSERDVPVMRASPGSAVASR